ncbi:hypothetical protein [Cytophaga aurantiaca]|uniref:hypothetical protein n=1 Tax=Cytophaga aurantiaca TaxID=29530 RepID=UPI0003700A87|nr:hypothetical protein [Cytophaga aurantiaca]
MKDLRNFCFFLTLFFTYTIAHGQTSPKNYLKPATATFHADSIFTPLSLGMIRYYMPSTHVWLTSLNSHYIDTTKNHINPVAVPAYHEIKNKGLFGPHHVKKQMEAGLYYHPYFFRSMPYGRSAYDPINKPYENLPYGYSPFSIKASGSPYFILPKF